MLRVQDDRCVRAVAHIGRRRRSEGAEPQVRGEQIERAAAHPQTGVSALLLALIGALSLSLGAALLGSTTRKAAHSPGVDRTEQ